MNWCGFVMVSCWERMKVWRDDWVECLICVGNWLERVVIVDV